MSLRLSSNKRRNNRKGNNNAKSVTSERTRIPSDSDSLPDVFSDDYQDEQHVVQLKATDEKENLAEMIGTPAVAGQRGSKAVQGKAKKKKAVPNLEETSTDINSSLSDIFDESTRMDNNEDSARKKKSQEPSSRNLEMEARIVSKYLLKSEVEQKSSQSRDEESQGILQSGLKLKSAKVMLNDIKDDAETEESFDAGSEDKHEEVEDSRKSTRTRKKADKAKEPINNLNKSIRGHSKNKGTPNEVSSVVTTSPVVQNDTNQSNKNNSMKGSTEIEEHQIEEDMDVTDEYGTPSRKLRNRRVMKVQINKGKDYEEESDSNSEEKCEVENKKYKLKLILEREIERTLAVKKEKGDKERKKQKEHVETSDAECASGGDEGDENEDSTNHSSDDTRDGNIETENGPENESQDIFTVDEDHSNNVLADELSTTTEERTDLSKKEENQGADEEEDQEMEEEEKEEEEKEDQIQEDRDEQCEEDGEEDEVKEREDGREEEEEVREEDDVDIRRRKGDDRKEEVGEVEEETDPEDHAEEEAEDEEDEVHPQKRVTRKKRVTTAAAGSDDEEEKEEKKSVKNGKRQTVSSAGEDEEESEDSGSKRGRSRKSKRAKGGKVKQETDTLDESSDRSSLSDFTPDFRGIRCTSCYQQLNQYNRKSLCEHPTLQVLICRRCIEYYHEGEFTKDEFGSDEQCQWCGEGGNLICCDFCSSAFCKTCICRNLSRREWTKIALGETSEWHCYVCDKEPLSELIKSCKSVIKWADKSKNVPSKREQPGAVAKSSQREEQSTSYASLHTFLEGRTKNWSFVKGKLDQSRKSAPNMDKKKLVQAVINIRELRKYLKSYQNHFERCLENIMSSGELSGGEETMTDSVPEEKRQEELSDERPEISGKKSPLHKPNGECIARRIKVTPKKRGSISDRETLGKDISGEENSSSSNSEEGEEKIKDKSDTKEGTGNEEGNDKEEMADVKSNESIEALEESGKNGDSNGQCYEDEDQTERTETQKITSVEEAEKMETNDDEDDEVIICSDVEESFKEDHNETEVKNDIGKDQSSAKSKSNRKQTKSSMASKNIPDKEKEKTSRKEEDSETEEDEFERLLKEEIEQEEKIVNVATKDKEVPSKSSKTTKQSNPKVKKSLTKDYNKDIAKSSKYIENDDSSDTEVSLIDVDLADEISRKMKQKKKSNTAKGYNLISSSTSGSDTDNEVEKMVQKAKKRKKQPTSSEESTPGEEKETKAKVQTAKNSKHVQKKRKKGSSSSDIDDEIEKLDDFDSMGPRKRSRKKGNKKNEKETPKKSKKGSKAKESVSSDSDEELPEVNYDTDVDLLGSSNQKDEVDMKLEDAGESLAEKHLREELENEKEVSLSSDSDKENPQQEKTKSQGAGKERKGQKGKSSDKKERKSDDSDNNDNGRNGAKQENKKKTKVHRLLKTKLISSSSSSDSDEEWNHKKKKLNDMLDKNDKKSKKKKPRASRKGKKDDSDVTTSESSDSSVGKKKKKTRKASGRNRSQTSGGDESSDIEFIKKVTKRKRKAGTQTDSSKGSSDDFEGERKKLRSYQAVGKKKTRIRRPCNSDSDGGGKASQEEGESGSDDVDREKGKGRKKIRKVMSKKKLAQETRDAAEEERERRKRVLKRRQELIASEMDSPQKSSAMREVILDKDPESKEVLLEVDKSLVKVLKPHQAKGIQFMWDCTFESLTDAEKPGGGCILAHCMGLGKTLQVIAYLHTIMLKEETGVKTALVVAPLNTVLNWEAEFEKWQENLDSDIEVYELASVKDNRTRADVLKHWHKTGGVMIMGYTMYRNLVFSRFVKNKRQKESFAQTLVDPGPDVVICDEGHLLKNDATATAKAMNSVRTRRRICLTGTPLQNNLIEYHCMVQFVKPQLLGTRKEFSNRFVNPISNGQCADSSPYDVKLMKKRAHILHNLLSGSVQRKDYSALAPYLPPKHEFVILIRLSSKQIDLYQRYLDKQVESDPRDGGRNVSLFKDYQVLMNVWTHPRLLKLAAIRTEKRKFTDEIRGFIDDETDVDTSEEEEVVEQVKDSSSDDELMKEIRDKHQAGPSNNAEGTDKVKKEKLDESDNSDSSAEVIKTWNTRRTRGDEEDDLEIIPPPPKKEWFTDLVDDTEDLKIEISGKMVLLFEILKLAATVGEKVLLFSQSLLTLDLIEDILEDQALKNIENGPEKRSITLPTNEEIEVEVENYNTWTKGVDYFRIDGSVEAQTRKAMADKFNAIENVRGRLFLVSTRAGSLGINLVAASRVIIFDACWNPSHDIQSIFRVYRFGQSKAVFIYRFIAQGTMEERIYDRQVTKQSLAQRVVDEHQVKRHYTQTELNELYNFQPDRLDDPDKPERPTPILPKDFVLAEILRQQSDWIVTYHEHDSLLENVVDESLTEEERKAAWSEYEAEKEGRMLQMANPGLNVIPGMPPPPPPDMATQMQQMQQQHHQQQQRSMYNHTLPHNFIHQANQGTLPHSYSALSRFLQMSTMNQPGQPPAGNVVRINPGSPLMRDFRPPFNHQPTNYSSMHQLIRNALLNNPGNIRNTVVHPLRAMQPNSMGPKEQPATSQPSASNVSKPP